MKKRSHFRKPVSAVRPFLLLLLGLLLCATPALAANPEVPPQEESILQEEVLPWETPALALLDPQQQALAQRWLQVQPQPVEAYTIQPSASAPYAIGELAPDYLAKGLEYLNFLRELAGLEPVALSDHLCVQAQYGAVLLAATDQLTHTPDKPQDMESSFYRMGANASAASNISMRFGFEQYQLLHSALRGHMDEESALNRLDLGHRRWLLDPALGKVGFGLAAAASGKQYIVVPVSDSSGTGKKPAYVTWPAAGQFPNNLFTPGTPWSVSLNTSYYQVPEESQLQVTVTRLRDGKVFIPSVLDGQVQLSEEGSYLLVSAKEYGSGPCVSFSIGKTALGEERYLGDYTVSISGLLTRRGNPAELEYTVRFFDAENLSVPAAWAVEEVTQALELELVPEPLTDHYQLPITRLEYCRLAMQGLRQKTGLNNEELVETYGLAGLTPGFSDCTDPDVLAAAAIGAVFGPGDGTFRPEGLITRQDAAVMLLQAAAAVGVEIQPAMGLIYGDGEDIALYARPAVQWVSHMRDAVSGKPVMAGVGNGKFDPLGTYTREQAMLTVLRLFRTGWTPVEG